MNDAKSSWTHPSVRARAAVRAVACSAIGAGLALTFGYGCTRHTAATKPERSPLAARESGAADATKTAPADDRLGLRKIAELAMPAVVSVASTHVVETEQLPALPFDDPFFRRFFGPGLPLPFQVPKGGALPPRQGLGSGVIVGGNVILTNAHVVTGAKTLVVTTQDRRTLEVEIAGTDPKSDLAALRIKGDAKGLKGLEFADSDTAHLGDLVLAIGNPFGLGETVTMGIVSAKGRADLGIADYEDFIQTDAAINPGNSGGALVDLNGRLLGIPTAILSRSGGYQGVGFAIPSNMARPIMQSLLETGRVARSYLGVTIQNVDQELAKALGLKSPQGVLLSDVSADGPSAKAGLQRGDVVLSINGKPMHTTGQLRNAVATAGVGKTVEVEIWRRGEAKKVAVTLGAMPEEKSPTSLVRPKQGSAESGPLGTMLAPLDEAARKQLDIPSTIKGGAVVVDVDVGSKAYQAGIRSGDVILEVAGTPTHTREQVKKVWEKSKGSVPVLLLREGRTLFVAVAH
jgi:serine protease Do